MPPKKPETEEKDAHPARDTSGRFAVDELLRSHGFVPWVRRKGRETVWLRKCDRQQFLQSEALKLLPKGEVDDAVYADEIYLDMLEDMLEYDENEFVKDGFRRAG